MNDRPNGQDHQDRGPLLADVDAEARVLGALLMLGSAASGGYADAPPGEAEDAERRADALFSTLAPGDFARAWHARIYGLLATQRRSGRPWGFAALAAQCPASGEAADLAGLVNRAVNAPLAADDAAAVRDFALRRRLVQIGEELTHLAAALPAREAIAQAQARLSTLALHSATGATNGAAAPVTRRIPLSAGVLDLD